MNKPINLVEIEELISNHMKIDQVTVRGKELIKGIAELITKRIKDGDIKSNEDIIDYLQALRKEAIRINQEKYNHYIN